MKLVTKIVIASIAILFFSIAGCLYASQPSYAASTCANVKTSYFSCPDGSKDPDTLEQTDFWQFMLTVINIIILLIGLVAIGAIVYGAILYASAADNNSQIDKAKTIIRDTIIGLVAFMAMYAFAQYLIPGGMFS